jgi:cell wall assembly regulator SMI1
LATLGHGATGKQIAAYEAVIGSHLPDDVQSWFRWRNGQKRFPKETTLFGYELLSLEASAEEWREWQGVQYVDLNDQIAESCTCRPPAAIRASYTLPGWIPLAQSPAQSNYIGIDLNPGPDGNVGQVINFGRDDVDKYVAGKSFADFLEFIVEELESGRVVVEPDGSTVHSYFYANLYGEPMGLFGILHRLHALDRFDGRRLYAAGITDRIVPLTPERGEALRRLHDAALNGELHDVRSLLDTDPELAKYRDPWGSTLLHLAAAGHAPEVLDFLSSFELDPRSENERGETPIVSCRKAAESNSAFEPMSDEATARYEKTLERLRRLG